MDKIDYLFKLQKQLQKKLGNTKLVGNQEFINIQILGAIDELMESIRETPWKPWKKKQKFNQENFKNELVDVWHFLINLTLASGMDQFELYDRFIDKNNINLQRKKEGY